MKHYIDFSNLSTAKRILIQAIILAIILTLPLLFAESGVGPAFLPADRKQAASDRPTDQSLKQLVVKHDQGFAGAIHSPQAPATAPPKEIYATSIILQDGDINTLLPPNAVIHIPPHLKNKITRNPVGKYVPWPQFYNANRNWLFTYQVTIKQAEGKEPIKNEVKSQFARINRIVVSIFRNHPISTLPKP